MTSSILFVALSLMTGDLNSRRSPVVQVVEKVSPAVVYVGTVQVVETRFRRRTFDDFFFGPQEERRAVEGLGSGVIIDASGIIVTNDHVIRGASEIHVVLADGRQVDAEVIGSDSDTDLAVLKINTRGPLPFAKLGTSSDLMIGESVIAIGSPLGLKKTVTVGVVSALGRSIRNDDRVFNDFIQTDASINPGNSGGPLLNVRGQVVGINTAMLPFAQGIGFAVPSSTASWVSSLLLRHGEVRRRFLGIAAKNEHLKTELATKVGQGKGVRVMEITRGSPASEGGVEANDLVLGLNGSAVENVDDLQRLLALDAASVVELKVLKLETLVHRQVRPTTRRAA